ncbi:MAG: hypothetical protein R3D71_02195 [Rickettsiales bacterium]
MSESVENTKKSLMEPIVLKVGHELRRHYNLLQALLMFGGNSKDSVEIVDIDKLNDQDFKDMATLAMKNRSLSLKTTDGETKEISFDEINRRIALLQENHRKKHNLDGFNLDALIPKEETIGKVADTIDTAQTEITTSPLNMLIVFAVALFNFFANGLTGKGWDFNAAKAEAASSHATKKINNKLVELAEKDHDVYNFLAQESPSKTIQHDASGKVIVEEPKNVLDSINATVPAEVYKKFGLDVPEKYQVPKIDKNLIATAVPIPVPDIPLDSIISKVRDGVRFPEKNGEKGDLADEIATKIFAGSKKAEEQAQAENKGTSLFNPKDKTEAYIKATLTNALALNSKSEAEKFSKITADAIADGFEAAVKDPDFIKLKDKEAAAEFIAQKVEEKLEAQRNNLKITKTLTGSVEAMAAGLRTSGNGSSLPDSHSSKKGRVYSVVTLDTKFEDENGRTVTVKENILDEVRKNITQKNFGELMTAAGMIGVQREKEQGNNHLPENQLQTKAKEAANGNQFDVSDASSYNGIPTTTISTRESEQRQV